MKNNFKIGDIVKNPYQGGFMITIVENISEDANYYEGMILYNTNGDIKKGSDFIIESFKNKKLILLNGKEAKWIKLLYQ